MLSQEIIQMDVGIYFVKEMIMQTINGLTWQCRWSPTLGELESTHQEVWGTDDYVDTERPTVFCGLYSLNDFYALWRHKGNKFCWWAGSDIRHFINGYWLDDKGRIRLKPAPLAKWINEKCESWVENDVEMEALKKLGIWSMVVPSFLGKVEDYEVSYQQSDRPKVYASVSGNDFELYHWEIGRA